MKKIYVLTLLTAVLLSPLNLMEAKATEESIDIVTKSEIEWGHLNPARGDKSPRAGQLWGDRTTSGASGFLVKFNKGFSSPPHIHNVTYRGVVISGLVHNDDPKAENMWLPAGSFWTQPAGEAHITSAEGMENIAYIEIDSGPYLVKPAEEAFDNGERPVNVDKSNLVWLNADDITWIEHENNKKNALTPKVAFLWGDKREGELNGSFVKIPAGFEGEIKSSASIFRAVIISGEAQYKSSDKIVGLEAGSYFGSDKEQIHSILSDKETVIYIRTNNNFEINIKN